MDTEIKDKWLEALLSGNYVQGMGSLRSHDNKFCCLGVLCDVMGVPWHQDRPDYGYYVVSNEGNHFGGVPGDDVREKAGISPGMFHHLWRLNDSGWAFHAIAHFVHEVM